LKEANFIAGKVDITMSKTPQVKRSNSPSFAEQQQKTESESTAWI
jgi:hypothetical protein